MFCLYVPLMLAAVFSSQKNWNRAKACKQHGRCKALEEHPYCLYYLCQTLCQTHGRLGFPSCPAKMVGHNVPNWLVELVSLEALISEDGDLTRQVVTKAMLFDSIQYGATCTC